MTQFWIQLELQGMDQIAKVIFSTIFQFVGTVSNTSWWVISSCAKSRHMLAFSFFTFTRSSTSMNLLCRLMTNVSVMLSFLWVGSGCLGDGGLPACASFRRHPQHGNTWQRGGLLPPTLQFLWWGPFGRIEKHGHRPTGPGREARSSTVDAGGRRSLCDRQTVLLQRHLCGCLGDVAPRLCLTPLRKTTNQQCGVSTSLQIWYCVFKKKHECEEVHYRVH